MSSVEGNTQAAFLQNARIAVLGLGYVGLPLTQAFAHALGANNVLGFDIDAARVSALNAAQDATGEADLARLQQQLSAGLLLTHDASALAAANVFIVTVPTPVNQDKRPDLAPLKSACETLACYLKPGSLVIFESTVYPGCTEDFCAPLLAEASGLRFNVDFFLGYSPERINPGDRKHRLANIVKITSGSTPEVAAQVEALYRAIIPAGTFAAASIRTAEAAKIIENIQRDVNIALMNEFAQVCLHLKIDSDAVLAAARSKWNFLDFRPGLVGGHCIGVDPYYLIHRAQLAGFHPALISTARVVNEAMVGVVCAEVLKLCARRGLAPSGAKMLILGVAFKENCADVRNSRVFDIARELRQFGAEVHLHDPVVQAAHGAQVEGEVLTPAHPGHFDLAILAVAHREFVALGAAGIRALLKPWGLIYDVKRLLPAELSDGRL
jgi:UDP-N-acetyl-D-glucosamine/UDP-N-acetyl-D-galactosamine dehydrogenase